MMMVMKMMMMMMMMMMKVDDDDDDGDGDNDGERLLWWLLKVILVKEVMSCDVLPVAMFSCWFNHDRRWNVTYILLVLLQSAIVAKKDLSLGEYKVDRNLRKAAPP